MVALLCWDRLFALFVPLSCWCLSGFLTWLCGSCVLQQALLPPAQPPSSLLLPSDSVVEDGQRH